MPMLHSTNIYRRKASENVETPSRMDGVSCTVLDAETIHRFFEDRRAQVFTRFLQRGYFGIALVLESQFVAYAWMTTPQSQAPPHLPARWKRRHWIFYCHTAESFRGRGLYQVCLKTLVERVARTHGHEDIYIDTTTSNTASRRAIMRVGFEPCGVVSYLKLPRLRPILARWNHHQNHPPIEQREAKS
jgi:GNAT superfamily N-acetyltransferase